VECINETDADITIRFEVTDSGAGIHKDAQKRIFEEFSQADGSTTRKYGGSGLGLAISSQLVEMMGGAIELESTVGVGSTFWFKCQFEKQVVTMRADSSVQPSGALTGLRALIIESSSINRGILHSQVDGWGMDTHVAETPDRALETLTQAAAAGAPYDMAIIDLGSAGAECMALAKAIRAATRTRLALLSPVGHPGLTPELQSAGIDASLVKPIRQSDLYECLVNMMAGRLSAGERAASLSASAEDHAAPSPTSRRVHVLLVEDNAINQAVAIGLLRKIGGYDVTVANNGLEALDAHARHSFDLILMDCHMPEMDGFAATNEIRKLELAQQRERVPVIALTANAMAQDRQDCLDAGMDDHLSKPFSRVQLQEMLTSWLQKSARGPSHDSAPANAAVLDRGVLDELRELQSDADPHLLAHVLDLYLSDSQKLVDKLNGALAANDIAGLERTLHTFKSTSGNVGATRLSQLCGELHTSIRSGDTEDLARRVGAIVAEHNLVQAALTAEKAISGTAHSAERDKVSTASV
jgi:CheY-like chemotaxis protein/HPt (histidine-containing phosphotransfer) domain-containing protein